MGRIASINTQIANIDMKMDSLFSEIEDKQEKKMRLKEAQTELIALRKDFFGQRNMCLEPEFSSKTFHGNQSDNYHTYRRMQLKESFKDISNTQILDALAKLQEKINELQDEVIGIVDEHNDLYHRKNTLEDAREAERKKAQESNA